ncbi:MAG: peptidylprolyl isomerase [Flavitalea sp.]
MLSTHWFSTVKFSMNHTIFIILVLSSFQGISQQKTIRQITSELENSPNPPLYVKDILKMKFRMDTVTVTSKDHFVGVEDSLAFYGKIKKVYGPYKGKVLLQILATIPTEFNHINQIFLDTSVFLKRFADSLANDIISRIYKGQSSFEDMAQSYSMGGEASTNGDLGWMARGSMVPAIEKELAKSKKNELIKVWSKNGLHIIRKTGSPIQGTGYALIMRVYL